MTKAAELAKMGEVLTNSQIGGRRNILINGGLQISQRGTDLNDLSNGDYTADRFEVTKANTDQLVVNYDHSTDTPDGFSNSLKLSVGTVESAIDTNEYVMINQRIEAQNLQHLKYGTSSAETLTLSFHVKSSVTGTYAISVFQQDANKYYSTTYTVNSANTWEYKTVKINGNTADVINNDNGSGLRLSWTLSSGSNFTSGSNDVWGDSTNWAVGHNASWITTSSATFFLTGTQLEVGDLPTGTPFEYRSKGEELALCQRYCVQIVNTHSAGTGHIILAGMSRGSTNKNFTLPLPVTMRNTTPSVTLTGDVRLLNPESHDYVNATDTLTCGGVTPTLVYSGNMLVLLYTGSVTGVTDTGNADYNFQIVAASDHLFIIDAEL